MKQFRKLLLIVLSVLMICAFAVFAAACNDKSKGNEGEQPGGEQPGGDVGGEGGEQPGGDEQEKTYTLTFAGDTANVDIVVDNRADNYKEGTTVTFSVTAKEGYTLVSVKNGSTELTAQNGKYSVTLNANTTVTVTATEQDDGPQTVAYTVEVYLAEGDGYVLSKEHSRTGAGEVGQTITLPALSIDGYVFRDGYEKNVVSLPLSEKAEENVFRFYYDVKVAGEVVYQGNAPDGAAVSGSVESTPLQSDGTATAAENGFSVTGYRFAGWSYAQDGAATVQPGDTVTSTSTVTLYAVWDKGYTNRFGGTDYIYVLSAEKGKVVIERGGIELAKTDIVDNVFTFTMPNKGTLEGKVFSDGTFAFAKRNLAGTYTFQTSYFNVDSTDGTTPPDPNTTLTIDKFGDATYEYLDEQGNELLSTGYVSDYSYSGATEYLFTITGGDNVGGVFAFRLGTVGSGQDRIPIFTSTNGEAGTYDQALTPDGNIFYSGQGFSIQLDGYGQVVMQHADYTGEWYGVYWIDGMYDLSAQYNIYKLHLLVRDDENGNLNTLTGAVQGGILEVSCYTMPLNDYSFAYVEPNEEAGEYQSAEGTLTLDGFRNFADSARYVVGDREYIGFYEAIWSQTGSKLTVVMHVTDLAGMYLGTDYTFGIDLTLNSNGSFTMSDTFSLAAEPSEGTPYRLLTDTAFGNTLLTIYKEDYEDESGTVLGKKASYGTVNTLGVYSELAEGYVKEGTFGYQPLVTFTRTSLKGEEDGTVPKSMICQLSSTYDSNFFLYDIFFVYSATYEREGTDVTVKNYTELLDETEGSEAKVWYMTLPAQGLNAGALYFTADGTVLAGAFTTDDGAYFGPVGIFTVLDPDTGYVDYHYFDLQRGNSGSYALFTEIDDIEYYVISVNFTGSLDNMVHLIRRGDEALYSESGDFDGGSDVLRCTVEWFGETQFGDTIFVLKEESDGREIMRFIMDSMFFNEPGYLSEDIFIYFTYDAAFDKTFSASDGSALTLDGFHRGSYTVGGRTYTGSYTLSSDKKIVYFSTTGRSFTFDISGGLSATDGVYGVYELNAGGWWNVQFDGHGNATATRAGRLETGVYRVEDDGTVLLFINLVEGVSSYRLQLFSIEGHGEALVYNENVAGTFIGDDWTILYLNGFRTGSYYFPDGNGWTTIYFEILDRSVGFVSIRTANYETQNVILDFEKKTMTYPEYTDRDYIFYADDLSALIVRESGEVEINYTLGSYVFANGVYRAYLDGYSVDLGSMPPKEGPWTVNGKTYYPATVGQEVTLKGTISVDYGNGSTESKEATLKFNLTGESVMTMDGVLTYDGTEYDVDLINTYTHSGLREGLSIVDWSRYDYSPLTSCKYEGEGKGTFTVEIKAQELVLTDSYEQEAGNTSTLTEYRVGFGPLDFADRTLSGKVYVGNDTYLEFSGAKLEPTDYYEFETGRRYNAVFTVDGTTYALQYSKEGVSSYNLYLIGTYEKVTANDGFSVGVIRYFYSNDAYEHTTTQKGAFCDFILYDESGSIVSFSRAVNAGRTSGWYVALKGYAPETQLGYPETIYLVKFADSTLKSVTVTAYGFMQAADGDTQNFANLCLDENGELADIAMLSIDGIFCSVDSYTESEGGYTVKLSNGATYLMTILRDADGKPLTYADGSWQIRLTAV